MSKKKTKAKQQVINQKQPSNDTFLQITAEELQNIIANALLQAEEQRKQIEKDKQEQERKKWKEEIGYKDYSKSNSIFAGFFGALNELKCGFKVLFMPSDKIKGHKTISASFSTGLSSHYLMVGLISLLLSLSIIIFTISFIILNLLPWYIDLVLFILSIGLFINALHNRLAYYEVTDIKDDNLILNILASHNSKISIAISIISVALSIISVAIAIIAIIK